MRHVTPDLRTVAIVGASAAALEAEGLIGCDPRVADGIVYFDCRPGLVGSGTKVVGVVTAAPINAPLPVLVSERRARRYVTLRDWVRGWFADGSALGRIASGILVSPAVGDRLCAVNWPGRRERIFSREAAAAVADENALKWALVTFCGAGQFPILPATLASALMIPPALAIYAVCGWGAFVITSLALALVATVLGVLLERWAENHFLSDDPREFVLDEVAGQALAWAFLPVHGGWLAILAGFFAFRAFDIFKWGIHWVETLPIRGKIVWDDLLAGLCAGVVVWVVWRVLA